MPMHAQCGGGGYNPFAFSALERGGYSAQAPAALPPGKTRYPLYRKLGGPQGRSGRVRKLSPPSGLESQTVQPVTSPNINYCLGIYLEELRETKRGPSA
jgi:hypothetical protein